MIWGGKPAEIVEAAEQGKVTIFISEEITAEINHVLAYPKIAKAYRQEITRPQLVEQVLKIAKFAKPTHKLKVIREHPADNRFLECPQSSNADYIVSGDRHLLNVGAYRKIAVLSVSDFLKVIRPSSSTD